MNDSQLGLPGMPVPPWVRAWWRAVQKHYHLESIARPPTNIELASSMRQAQRTFDRDKNTYRDWIHPKPPREWRPNWLGPEHTPDEPVPNGARTVRTPAVDDRSRPVLVEEVFDAQGRSIVRRLVEPMTALAAGLAGDGLLDMASDGRLDGTVRFLKVCVRAILA